MNSVKKYILSIIIFSFVFLALTPYFTNDFLDLRQQKENEEMLQKQLVQKKAKEKAKRDALQKIYLTGKFDPAIREDFALVPSQHILNNANQSKMYLRKETLNAFLEMQNFANKDGVDLKIASATRNFDYQKNLWNNKWSGITLVEGRNLSKSIQDSRKRFEKILEYSAAPGTSRHHWGTDIDINGATTEYFETEQGKEAYNWLVTNAPLFGFCQTYDFKGSNRPTGYNEEKWHWSYLPLAQNFTQEYKELITEEDIQEFKGDEYVPNLDLINNYVLAINPDCI